MIIGNRLGPNTPKKKKEERDNEGIDRELLSIPNWQKATTVQATTICSSEWGIDPCKYPVCSLDPIALKKEIASCNLSNLTCMKF